MHTTPSLLPSVSSCSSLDSTTVSSTSMPPTANDLDETNKRRLVKQTRKLSQILGELPREATARPHTARSSTLTAEAPSTDLSQQHQQRVRFSRQRCSFIDPPSRPFRFPLQPSSEATGEMFPPLLGPAQNGLERSSSARRHPSTRPSHTSQLDLTRFGLGRLRRAGSARSGQSDENARLVGLLSDVAEIPTRSTSLRVPNYVHQVRPREKLRRRSVHNPSIIASQTPSQKSTGISSATRPQRRSVSLWTKRKTTRDDSVHHQRPITGQSREDDDWDDERPPLTEERRIQSLRRGRKLTQVFGRSQLYLSGQLNVPLQLFGTEPPIALYRSPFEDGPTHNTITEERIKTYVALSSGPPSPVSSGRSSIQFSRSSVSSISVIVPSSDSMGHGVETLEEPESDKTPAIPLLSFDDDLDSIAQLPCDPSNDSATASFRRRRLRAAKLSRFFGVAYNDLSIPTATTTQECRTSGEGVSPAEVGVTVQERGRFWSRAEGGYKDFTEEADMNDVIALLRQMPRA